MNKPDFFVTPGYGEYMLNELQYSQAVKIGDRVETSGQGGWDNNLQIPESLADEITQAFRNLGPAYATGLSVVCSLFPSLDFAALALPPACSGGEPPRLASLE